MTYFAHWVPEQYRRQYRFIRGLDRDAPPYLADKPRKPSPSYEVCSRDHLANLGSRLSDIIEEVTRRSIDPKKVEVNIYDGELSFDVYKDEPNPKYEHEKLYYDEGVVRRKEEISILAELHRIWSEYNAECQRKKKREQLELLAKDLGVSLVDRKDD